MYNVHLKYHVNPRGNVLLEWKVPLPLLLANPDCIPVQSMTYLHSSLLGVPVPFTTYAVAVKASIFECYYLIKEEKVNLKASLEENFYQHIHVRFSKLKDLGAMVHVVIKITIENVVNRDGLYYNIVYSIVNTFKATINLNITASVHFASNIKSYSFTPRLVDSNNGKCIGKVKGGTVRRDHDIVIFTLYNFRFKEHEEIDMKFIGSRLPVYINYRLFWLIILLIAIIISLSAIVEAFK